MSQTSPIHPEDAKKANEVFYASQWQLIWRKFRKHRVAGICAVVLMLIYILTMFCEFFAPHNPLTYNTDFVYAPPQRIRFVGEDGFSFRPFVYGYTKTRDMRTFRDTYEPDPTQVFPLEFFPEVAPYRLLGIWEVNRQFFGVQEGYIFLLGTDRMGRDMLSRILYGGRISTTIGLIGVLLSLVMGVVIGGFSGYFGGLFDSIVQRIMELLRTVPTIPLWMGLSAALPEDWTPVQVFLGISIILSFQGWTALGRQVRSKFMSLKQEDFVVAAELIGSSRSRVVFMHMLPSFMSHIIASVTLAIPSMILGETSLSFLGLGLRPPIISWGVLLQEAQNVRTLNLAPWLFLPGAAVVVTVLAFNFLGDGLRDAADPYGGG